MRTNIQNTYEGIILVDYVNGNPNGDFNAGGAPTIDPIDGRCRSSAESFKAKVRAYWASTLGLRAPFDILHRGANFLDREDGEALTIDDQVQKSRVAAGLGLSSSYEKELAAKTSKKTKKGGKQEPQAKDEEPKKELSFGERRRVSDKVFEMYIDARVFGAMLGVGNDRLFGTKGPFVICDGLSVHPVIDVHQANTRQMLTREKEKSARGKTVGNRVVVRYALMQHLFTLTPGSAHVTGMSMRDLWLTLDAMLHCWTLDAAPHRRGVVRGLWLFRQPMRGRRPVPHDWTDVLSVRCNLPDPYQASSFNDFDINLNSSLVPDGVDVWSIAGIDKILERELGELRFNPNLGAEVHVP